ncbi:hypothetical protein [Chryseobacterium arthrosphaerae]|uniref:hypothetical protein n=1 Tax=Chryseobacterium arthrosphaerae TaxID=651561 RepID=UPI001E53E2D8|nr:hypothetical protein [Chryseobacterium arthrosphaerae]UEQ78997.1 hypothetical protein J8N07_12065 [Chryseobacterium arthrosphaerae]
MKTKILLLLLLGWWGIVNSQFTIDSLQKMQEAKLDDQKFSDDIYNPINFTKIIERMPKANGYNTTYDFILGAGLDYIKKGSQIHINFNRKYIDALGSNCKLQVLAYIQRKDKTIKPLNVLGFTIINEETQNTEAMKNGNISGLKDVNYLYKINTEKANGESYSGEINLTWEEISYDDRIVLHITNKAKNNTGFIMTLVYDDFGWKQNPIGGFSFVKIAKKGFTEFSPAASIGYTFRYQPRKSNFFWWHFLSPSFGPMLHVFQNNENTTIGTGLSVSTFYNMVSFGGGWTINGINHGKPYFSIGLNFIESYNTLTSLLKK